MNSPLVRLIAVALVGASLIFAQATGRLSGVVTDQSGGKIPAAKVSLFLADGKTAVAASETNTEGLFDFVALRPALYHVEIERQGFVRYRQASVKVDPARETALPVTLQIATTSETVEVVASAATVQVANFEIATTVTQQQVEKLPLLDRQVRGLFLTQAAVNYNQNHATTINGVRPSYTAITLDGINVQDNWVRTNTIDFMPNRLTIAQVAEVTVNTSNSNTSLSGGANQISMVSPSGTNTYHGSLYWYNRNSHFAANDWFSNKNGLDKPGLNLNQFGGTIGGPIQRDKLFFYANYETFDLHEQSPQVNTILTPNARQGILTYRDASGAARTFNVLSAFNLTPDPYIQNLLQSVPAQGNSTDAGDGLNTTGWAFNARSNIFRRSVMGKGDYYLSQRHAFAAMFNWNKDTTDRPDQGTFYTTVPPVRNDGRASLFSTSWRWTASPTLTNEVRGGFNRTFGPFVVDRPATDFLVFNTLFSSPVNTTSSEARHTNTYSVQDNANWIRGRHSLSFGYQAQFVRVNSVDYTRVIPEYVIGLASNSPYGFGPGDIPGLRGNDVGQANSLLATLAGILSEGRRNFNVTSRTSGFVGGKPIEQNFLNDTHAFYVSDSWKLNRRISVVLGLRWDYFAPVDVKDALLVQPVLINNNTVQTLLGNANLDFTGRAAGRPLYQREFNNFAPNVGFALDPFGDGKMAIRAGYSIAYAYDNVGNSISNATSINGGMIGQATYQNRHGLLRALPALNAPPYAIPTTTARNWEIQNFNAAQGMVDPRLRTPYVQQYSFGIQREVKGILLEGRFVGNHGVGVLRQIDFNQVNPRVGGFLDDFIRARSNGFLAAARGLGFNPTYNPNVPGSQPLPVFAALPGGGFLTNATVRGQIQRGEPGALAQTYFTADANGDLPFFANPNALYSSLLTNFTHSSYNSLQLEARKSMRNGMHIQASYVYGKVLTDANALRAIDAQIDNAAPRVERGRATFDLTHQIKINHTVPLPFGKGHRLDAGPLNRVVGGWTLSGYLNWQTGAPVSILSARGTLNRVARSTNNTVDTSIKKGDLDKLIGLYQTGNGPYFLNPSVIGPDGRGVAADGSTFNGQVFFNPQPGTQGSLQKRWFSGPNYANYDFSLGKAIPITERHRLEFRADFFNLTNHPAFLVTATPQNVNSSLFGRVLTTANSSREIQFGLYYRF